MNMNMNMDRLITLIPFRCPTSSATWARVWFELRSSGLRVIAIGLGVAVLIYLLFALGVPYVPFRPFAIIGVFGAVPASLLIFARNAFGIRRKQKRAYISAFEATQPCNTAQFAGVKLLVRTACVLIALVAIGGSSWKSSSLMNSWGPWPVKAKADMTQKMLQTRSAMGEGIFGTEGSEIAKSVVSFVVDVFVVVVALAALAALLARYSRRVIVSGSLLFLGILVVQTGRDFSPHAIYSAMPWVLIAAISFATGYFLWSGLKERALTISYVCAALVIAAANAVACLPGSFGSIFATAFVPLLLCVLAPWALNRIRHT
jgi:hypothetical protein